VWRRATSWTAGVRFPAVVRDFSVLHSVQTVSDTHSASYPVGAGAHSPGVSGRGMKLTIHLHLEPRTRMVELYLHSLIRLHGVVVN
jgi:hypothetical protein